MQAWCELLRAEFAAETNGWVEVFRFACGVEACGAARFAAKGNERVRRADEVVCLFHFAAEVGGVNLVEHEGFIYPAQVGEGELVLAELERDGCVFKLLACGAAGVANDGAVVEFQNAVVA